MYFIRIEDKNLKYMGSKNRISKHILPIMLRERKPDQWWVEPFVGGGNMIDKVKGKRLGSDINPYVIEALISIRDHVSDLPKNKKEFTENDYMKLKDSDVYKYKGYAGFSFSYGAKWLGGWRRDNSNKRDYVNESYRNALKQSSLIQGVEFLNKDYLYLKIPDNSLIYCDPPYKGTTGYRKNFDHERFWQWCRDMANCGNVIFISEYNAPKDFKCVWCKEIVSSLTRNTGSKKGVEKLFRFIG